MGDAKSYYFEFFNKATEESHEAMNERLNAIMQGVSDVHSILPTVIDFLLKEIAMVDAKNQMLMKMIKDNEGE